MRIDRARLRAVGWGALVVAACADGTSPEPEVPAPADLGDGWTVAAPASVGLDPTGLLAVADRVERGDFGEIHALLAVRHGVLAFEGYFNDYDGTDPHTLQSVTKSITSALIGIAVDRGEIPNLDLTLGELFPDYADILDADPLKASIRIRDLLTMRAGMAWDEQSYPFADDRNDTGRMNRSADWVRTTLEQPMVADPGTSWTYNSGAVILLSAALLRLTGHNAIDYAQDHLFGPMGFGDFIWYRNPVSGLPHTGGGLRLLPRDLARFGQLYLDRGTWHAARVVSESWVEASEIQRASIGSTGYGYLWWMRALTGVSGHQPSTADVLYGWGYAGQHVFVSRDLDLVVVVNAWNEDGSTRGPQLFDALVRAVTP